MSHENDRTSRTATGFARFRVGAADAGGSEWLAAEAWAAGAAGVEERELEGRVELIIYAPAEAIDAVRDAVAQIDVALDPSAAEPVIDSDWTEEWKRGLEAIEVSPRLLVRPSFVSCPVGPDQHELVVDPGQAFGTGGHASTRLTLEWIDALAGTLPAGGRMLDVGTGTGVLALAAIRLAEMQVIAFDLDPLAAEAARENAEANGIDSGLSLYTGPLEALAPVGFDLVVANLLKSEMLPLVAGIAERTRPGGHAIFAGLLAREADEVRRVLEAVGFEPAGVREADDANGDRWTALLMRR